MYAYLDRTPEELPPGARHALVALRLWCAAAKAHECTVAPLHILFSQARLSGAVWPAHNLFSWIGAHLVRTFQLGCSTCGSVSEDEALLLTAIFDSDRVEDICARALGDIIKPDSIPRAVRTARALARELNASADH